MTFIPADSFSIFFFAFFSAVMASAIIYSLRLVTARKKWIALFLILVGVFSAASLSGIVAAHFIPFGPMLFALLFIFGFGFSFSSSGLELSMTLPLSTLIGFQGFRLPLEVLLHHWVKTGTIPETMTWSGQSWDVVSGVVALISMPLVNKNSKVAMVVNILCFGLLLNVIRVVIMSSPLPFSWNLPNPLLLIAYFPYALIAPLFVLPALMGHLLVFRKLLK